MENETKEAEEYWSTRGVTKFYRKEGPRHLIMRRLIDHLHRAPQEPIKSVYEFGCHAGLGLQLIKEKWPEMEVSGSDLNVEAMAYGREAYGLCLVGGYIGACDFVYTSSVLCHIPNPRSMLKLLLSTTKRYVALLEPYNGEDRRALEHERASEFSYFHDYPAMLGHYAWASVPAPLRYDRLGPHYRIFLVDKCRPSIPSMPEGLDQITPDFEAGRKLGPG